MANTKINCAECGKELTIDDFAVEKGSEYCLDCYADIVLGGMRLDG